MGISVRSYVIVGASAMAAAVIAIPPSIPVMTPAARRFTPLEFRWQRADEGSDTSADDTSAG